MIYDPDVCENCGRSMIEMRPGDGLNAECGSCRDDFKRLNAAGKLQLNGWMLEVVKSPKND